jgi:hypothetical protein
LRAAGLGLTGPGWRAVEIDGEPLKSRQQLQAHFLSKDSEGTIKTVQTRRFNDTGDDSETSMMVEMCFTRRVLFRFSEKQCPEYSC